MDLKFAEARRKLKNLAAFSCHMLKWSESVIGAIKKQSENIGDRKLALRVHVDKSNQVSVSFHGENFIFVINSR